MTPRRDWFSGRIGVWIFSGERYGGRVRAYDLAIFYGWPQ